LLGEHSALELPLALLLPLQSSLSSRLPPAFHSLLKTRKHSLAMLSPFHLSSPNFRHCPLSFYGLWRIVGAQ
jgi:hypothetical protein